MLREPEGPYAPLQVDTRLEAGAVLGARYRVLRFLNRGAQGEVYEVEHLKLRTRFAAKVLRNHLLEGDEAFERFKREAEAASQIQHPNVARVIDFDRLEGEPPLCYAVMELLDGEDLAQALLRAPLTVRRSVQVAKALAQALEAAHQAGVVHRDLKPSNVLLSSRGVKLTDFGISKFGAAMPSEGTRSGTLTGAGMVVGTPRYMAPEQATGDPVDGRADLYALGLVLFEMLTGVPLFTADSATELLHQKACRPTPEIAGHLRGLPRSLLKLLKRATARAPEARFSKAAQMVAALVQLEGLPDRVYAPKPAWRAPVLSGGAAGAALGAVFYAVVLRAPASGQSVQRSPVELSSALDAGHAEVKKPIEPPVTAPKPTTEAPGALEPVLLKSVPAGAKVWDLSGQLLGTTPLALTLTTAQRLTVSYRSRKRTIEVDPKRSAGAEVWVRFPRRAVRRGPKRDPDQPIEVKIE